MASAPIEESTRSSLGVLPLIEIVAILGIGLVLGYLGWLLPSVGGSLFVPTMIVLGVGVALFTMCGFLATRLSPETRRIKFLTVGAIVTIALAAFWTFQFSLPVAVWSSNASEQAQVRLSELKDSPLNRNGVVPAPPCTEHDRGNIGPLSAPYKECAIWTPEGHFVTFTEGQSRGLGYTDAGAATFPDECVRHLEGEWWMFVGSNDPSDPGHCPIGYQFQGGG